VQRRGPGSGLHRRARLVETSLVSSGHPRSRHRRRLLVVGIRGAASQFSGDAGRTGSTYTCARRRRSARIRRSTQMGTNCRTRTFSNRLNSDTTVDRISACLLWLIELVSQPCCDRSDITLCVGGFRGVYMSTMAATPASQWSQARARYAKPPASSATPAWCAPTGWTEPGPRPRPSDRCDRSLSVFRFDKQSETAGERAPLGGGTFGTGRLAATRPGDRHQTVV
jgi:hypothetical protein